MELNLIVAFLLGNLTGAIGGLLGCFFVSRGSFDTIRFLSVLLFFVWTGLHIYGFVNNKQISLVFDVVGGASVGHLLGFDLGKLLSKMKK